MSFIASIFEAIIDVIVYIVEAVIQVIEMIIHLIMILLGWDSGSTQIIEYYEVHNVPLFDDVDKKNPLQQSVIQSVIEGKDISSNLIYHLAFRSLKGNVKEFMQFIDVGNYFENFPTVESYILIVDYDELTGVLNTLNGVPCTIENAFLRALSNTDWIQYWLQENKGFDVGANLLGTEYREVTTSPATPAGDTVTVIPSLNHFDVAITNETVTSDDVLADMRWKVNFNTVVYNPSTDDYTVQVYNEADVIRTLSYTVPSKPVQLHYVSTYYRDVAPARGYIFIYKVGTGTYTDLDTVETPIDIDGNTLEVLPAIPLRISNANYTTFGATKQAQIEDLLSVIHLNAEDVLDAVMNDPGIAPGDLDNIYVNFGVRMWDISQAGMSYLYTMFENLYPSQGVTQGTYNNSPSGDDKPQNNILTTTEDNKYAFQFSYISYEHTSLLDIDANSGSTENAVYYSDLSKFGDDGLLKYNYFVSSGKGTYNVGYKADTLTEVANFLAGNGTPNPGTTTGEAANWLQVTERMVYNNPSPILLEAAGGVSTLIFLTPDLVYENNGSGVLQLIEAASEATTVGQSITYYCCKPSGLDAYTVVAPIGALKVIDGDTGHFRMVKFNLGNQDDLMVPFVHNFIRDLSNSQVSKLFLAGAHVSIYIAHYEVIVHAGMSFFKALVMLIIIIVVIYFAWVAGAKMLVAFKAAWAAAVTMTVAEIITLVLTEIAIYAFKFVAQMVIQKIIVEIAGDDEELAMILNLIAMVAMSSWDVGASFGSTPGTAPLGSYGHTGGADLGFGGGSLNVPGTVNPQGFHITGVTSFSALTAYDYAKIALEVLTGINTVALGKIQDERALLEQRSEDFQIYKDESELERAGRQAFLVEPLIKSSFLTGYLRATNKVGKLGADKFYALCGAQYDIPYTCFEYSQTIQSKVSSGWQFE